MKTLLNHAVVIFLFFLFAYALSSCKKNDVPQLETIEFAKISWDVYEQQNVSHYTVETSIDGNTDWIDAGTHFSDNKTETNYSITIDITRYSGPVWGRIKSFDIDGKVLKSTIFLIRI